jgi:hypothetical protein
MEVERVRMLLYCQIQYRQMVVQEQVGDLGFGCTINQKKFVIGSASERLGKKERGEKKTAVQGPVRSLLTPVLRSLGVLTAAGYTVTLEKLSA